MKKVLITRHSEAGNAGAMTKATTGKLGGYRYLIRG